MARVRHFFRDQLLGEGVVPTGLQSLALFCPHCGKTWYRINVDGAAWGVTLLECERHPRKWSFEGPPGSAAVTSPVLVESAYYLAYFPPGAVRREFELHLNAAEKGELE